MSNEIEKLEHRMRVFDAMLSALPDFVYAFDRNGRFIFVNDALLSLWGLKLEEAVGKNFTELQYPAELAAKLERQIQHVFETGESVRDETPYTSQTGAGGYYEYIFAPVRGRSGEMVAVAGSTRDITERKASERERERLQEENAQLLQAERAARAEAERLGYVKDEFLATLSHELRTPLNAILGWSQLLRRGRGSVEEGLGVIERNAQVQRQLISDLLDMSRIVSGKVRLDTQRIDIREIIGAAVATIQLAAEAKQIRLVQNAVTAEIILGDTGRLQQVILNLLTNAIKFTPAGGTIEVSGKHAGSHVEICVRDTGSGIDPEFLPHVFERFRQSDASTTRIHGGLGLGLAIAKTLVELHGGRISAESEGRGKGASFFIMLPRAAENALPAPERSMISPGVPVPTALEENSGPELLAGVKVLVVDDEADGRDLIARILRDSSAEVAVAGGAQEALKLFTSFVPDVVLSDIGMPGVDGYELIHQLRALGPGRHGDVPAAALTALARSEDRIRALHAGFQTHLAKPIDAFELVAVVASLAGRITGQTAANEG